VTRAPAQPDALLARELGVRQLAAAILNYTVGSGIFALPAVAMAMLGAAAPLAFVVCAVVITLVVLCLAEAGSRVTATGGPYAYVTAAFGPFVGFQAGALLWLIDIAGTSAVAVLFAGSLARLVGTSAAPALEAGLVVAVFVCLAAANVRGVRHGARLLEAVTVPKLLALLAFVAVGASFVDPANLSWDRTPAVSGVLGAAGVLIFAFVGIEAALLPSGEVRDPARTVPRAAILALGTVSLLYLAIQVVAQGVLGPELASDRVTPLASAAERFAGGAGRVVLLAAASLSTLGYLAGALLAGPRSLFAFGRDGFLPRALAAVHPRHRTPHVAIVSYAIVAGALALSGTFERLAILTSVAVLLLYLVCALAAWQLRRRDVRGEGEPFRTPGGPVVPVLACASVAWVLAETATRRELVAVGVVLACAAALYVVRVRRRGSPSPG